MRRWQRGGRAVGRYIFIVSPRCVHTVVNSGARQIKGPDICLMARHTLAASVDPFPLEYPLSLAAQQRSSIPLAPASPNDSHLISFVSHSRKGKDKRNGRRKRRNEDFGIHAKEDWGGGGGRGGKV